MDVLYVGGIVIMLSAVCAFVVACEKLGGRA